MKSAPKKHQFIYYSTDKYSNKAAHYNILSINSMEVPPSPSVVEPSSHND